MQQKAVLKLDLHDEKDKKKAMKTVSGFAGIDSITLSMKDCKLTVTGDFDPVHMVEKLRKLFPTNIESIGPAKDEKKGNDQAKPNDGDKNNNNYWRRPVLPLYYYDHRGIVEEEPNGCIIC